MKLVIFFAAVVLMNGALGLDLGIGGIVGEVQRQAQAAGGWVVGAGGVVGVGLTSKLTLFSPSLLFDVSNFMFFFSQKQPPVLSKTVQLVV